MFGGLACGWAFHGQTLLPNELTRLAGTRWYAAGILLMILAWRGTYSNSDLLSVLRPGGGDLRARDPAPLRNVDKVGVSRILELRGLLGFVALLLNFYAIVRLRVTNYDSTSAGLLWLLSLALMATAFVGERSPPDLSERPGAAGDQTDIRLARTAELLLVLVVFALALGLRLYRLGDWTTGIHGDEGEVGMDALRILQGHRVPPFRVGWFGQPNFYYWAVALGMKVFGKGLTGLRMFSTLCGALMILPFYPLVRMLFGVRAAILASVLLAISDVAIHFSRQEFSNVTTPLLLVTGFFLLFRGLKRGRTIDFVLAGYAHALCLYFYLGGRLTPLIAAAFFADVVVVAPAARFFRLHRKLRANDPGQGKFQASAVFRAEARRVRPLVSCFLGYSVAAYCMAAPWIAFYLDNRQQDSRVQEKLIFNHPVEMAKSYGATHDPLYLGVRAPQSADALPLPLAFERTTLSVRLGHDGFWPRVLWAQLKATLSILTYRFDSSGVYTFTMEPVTKPIEAMLIVLGIAWALWRWRDERMALISIWFWLTILVGGVMTIDAPYMARLVGIVPVLAIFAALVLDKMAAELVRFCRQLAGPADGSRVGHLVGGGALLSLMGFLTWQNATDYYRRYLGQWPFSASAGQASFVRKFEEILAKEGRTAPKFYSLGVHDLYWGYGPNRFLNYGATGVDVANPSDALPILDNGDRDAVFMVWGVQSQYVPVIRAYYPEAQQDSFLYGPPGQERPLFTYCRVKSEQIVARRVLEARYVPAAGRPVTRSEASLGSEGPAPEGLVYPLTARWSGTLIAPAFGRYRFRLESGGPSHLSLDDTSVLVSGGRAPSEREVVLARGAHLVDLSGSLRDAESRILVRWSVAGSDPAPVAPRFLWSGPGRGLRGEVLPLSVGQSPPARGGSMAVQHRIDGFLGFRDARTSLAATGPVTASWNGRLMVPHAGRHRLDVFSNGSSTLWLDGKLIVDNTHPDGPPRGQGAEVELTAGEHSLSVGYSCDREVGYLEVYWTPPGGSRAILGPEHLSATGGLWRPDQFPELTPLAPQLIEKKFVPATRAAAEPRQDTRGCAFDARGNLYVADAEHDRLAVLDAGGKRIRSLGSKGRGRGEFSKIEDVAIGPEGRIYVLDSSLARVQIFNPDGHLVQTIDGVGCSPAGFSVDSDGTVYVAAPCDSAVLRYAPSGKRTAAYRGGIDPRTRLEQPVDVVVAPGGALYVADLRDRVVKIDPSTDTIEKTWPVHVSPAFGGANLVLAGQILYLTDPGNATLCSIDTQTGRMETFPAGDAGDPEFAVRRSGVGPCPAATALVSRYPLCLGELLARCGSLTGPPSPR